jgi:hypothetical protein
MFIQDAKTWAKKAADEPLWVAQCLQRVGRFGGQHPTSNVLIHSLEVWWMLRHEDPVTQLWALYHDAHETLTGDITRPVKNRITHNYQVLLDAYLQEQLGITYTGNVVAITDAECGDTEAMMWGDVCYSFRPEECCKTFVSMVRAVRQEISNGL